MIFQRSSDVPIFEDYTQYRNPYLRPDFQYHCAYCLTHEHFFLDGEGGEIDHHRPLKPLPALGKDFSHLKNTYANLYWTCGKCNRCKGNRWPSDVEYAAGEHFLDPCAEDHDSHWETFPDGTLQPTTPTGHYTIRHLRLNRPVLVRRRQQFREDQQMLAQVERELAQRSLTPEYRQARVDLAEELRKRVSPPHFS